MITFLPCFELVLANFPAQPGHAYQEAAAATNHLLAGVKFPLSETEEHVTKENVESIALFPNIWFPVFGKNQEKNHPPCRAIYSPFLLIGSMAS